MKKSLIGLSILFATATLSGCSGKNYAETDYCYFHIESGDYYKKVLVKDVLNLSEEEFYNALIKDAFTEQLKGYKYDGLTYSNGTSFVFGSEAITNYVNESIKNKTYDRYDFGLANDTYGWDLTIKYSPIIFTIDYVGHENDPAYANYKEHSVENNFDLPVIECDEKTQFKGWLDVATGDIYYSTNDIGFKDVTVQANITPKKYFISYKLPLTGLDNPNPASYTYLDSALTLEPIPDHPLGGYSFKGWYLDEEYTQPITTIDPASELKDYVLYGKIDIPTFTIKYFVDDALQETKTLTYPELDTYEEPIVPSKSHYVNARWSAKVERYANYEIYAQYDKESYTITILNNAGKPTQTKTLEYLDTLEETLAELEALAGSNESFVGLFSDETHNNKIDGSAIIDSDLTLYAYYEQIAHLSKYEDLLQIDSNFKGTYVLDNDVSCVGEALPYLESFSGVFDGKGHSIKRFSNTNASSPATSSLFGVNNGTIKNVTFEDGTFVLKNTSTDGYVTFGMICSNNNGIISEVDVKGCSISFSPIYNIYVSQRYDPLTLFYAGVYAGINDGEIYNCEIDDDTTVEFSSSIAYTRDDGTNHVLSCITYYGASAGRNRASIKNVTSSAYLKNNKLSISENIADWQDTYFTSVNIRNTLGGISGTNDVNGVIENSISHVHIETTYNLPGDMKKPLNATNHVGGICGYNVGNIKLCFTSNTALIHSYAYAEQRLGGIAGSNLENGKIKSCYSLASFRTGYKESSLRIFLGGIIGFSAAQMNYCYAAITSIQQEVPVSHLGSTGTLIGYAENNSTSSYCFGLFYLEEEYVLTHSTCDYANCALSAIFANIAICVPEQLTNVLHIEDIKQIETPDGLYAQAASYYFDEAGYTLSDSALPIIEGIGRLSESL